MLVALKDEVSVAVCTRALSIDAEIDKVSRLASGCAHGSRLDLNVLAIRRLVRLGACVRVDRQGKRGREQKRAGSDKAKCDLRRHEPCVSEHGRRELPKRTCGTEDGLGNRSLRPM